MLHTRLLGFLPQESREGIVLSEWHTVGGLQCSVDMCKVSSERAPHDFLSFPVLPVTALVLQLHEVESYSNEQLCIVVGSHK